MNPPSLGYVILYVNDVASSLAFYEKAFALARRFFHDDNGKTYGELENPRSPAWRVPQAYRPMISQPGSF